MDFLWEREVRWLVHFTPVENLGMILKEGIVPRKTLGEDGNAVFLDHWRLDGHLDRSCFSLSWPNVPLLYRHTLYHEHKMAVLFIEIECLKAFDRRSVFFFPTNAASSISTSARDKDNQGVEALERMFAQSVQAKRGLIHRKEARTPRKMTTDSQAEVQIVGVVPPTMIRHILVDSRDIKKSLIKEYNALLSVLGANVRGPAIRVNGERYNLFGWPEWWDNKFYK